MSPRTDTSVASVLDVPNVRLFVRFRLFFNARFYYPVFTILFLDFGLTLEQFAVLNALWAATIVLAEVPSGAMADIIGRKKLLVISGALMVLEMVLLVLVPLGNATLLFWVFSTNRILSGLAEAAASGADEAIAYDALISEGHPQDWPKVLEHQMRVQSIGFIVAMSLGAVVYDSTLVNALLAAVGIDQTVSQSDTIRFPIYLTLFMAVMALGAALKMTEVADAQAERTTSVNQRRHSVGAAFKVTIQAGAWILKTPFALVVILTGLVFDSCLRLVVTLNSQYFRLIDIPEAVFGVIGSAMAVSGLFIPRLARHLAQNRSPFFNLVLMTIITVAGLTGLTFFWPVIGLLPVLILAGVMFLLNFFVSHYLNQIASSSQRATVLSFKGLSMNLAYGAIGLMYSVLLAFLKHRTVDSGVTDTLPEKAVSDMVFKASIDWFPWYFLVTVVLLVLFAGLRYGSSRLKPSRHQ